MNVITLRIIIIQKKDSNMFDNKAQVPYTQRMEKVFQRIQNIMANNQDQRSDKMRDVLNLIRQHQKMSQEKEQERINLFESIFQRISTLQKRSVQQANKREKSIVHLHQSFNKVQKKYKSITAHNLKQRQQMQNKFRERIDNIFNKQKDLLEEVMGYTNDNLNQLSLQQQKIPALREQLAYESELRSEIQSKIYQQFLQQISELKKLFENQKSQRIQDHEQTLIHLKSIYTKFIDKLKNEQASREKNEALILRVVQQLVNQISSSYNS